MTGGSFRLTSTLGLDAQKALTAAGLTVSVSPSLSGAQALAFGTGAGTASVVAVKRFALAAGATETIDLYDGSLMDLFDDAAAFRLVRGWAFWVNSGGDSSGVKLTGGASNPHGLDWVGTPGTGLGQTVYPSGPAAGGGGGTASAVSATVRTLKATNNGAVYAEATLYLAGTANTVGTPIGLLLSLTYP